MGSYEVAKLLLEYGAEVNVQSKRNEDSQEIAKVILERVEHCEKEMQKMINMSQMIDEQDQRESKTPLMIAVRYDCKETVSLFLEHGADLSITDSDGKTAYDDASPEIKEMMEPYQAAQEKK